MKTVILPFLAALGLSGLGVVGVWADQVIPNEYIVMLRDQVALADHLSMVQAQFVGQDTMDSGVRNEIMRQWPSLKGYSAVLTPDMAQHLASNDDILFLEENRIVHAHAVQNDPENWGLARISKRSLPLRDQYYYFDEAGEGVDIYILDTGIFTAHDEFEGRATNGKTYYDGSADGNGHGTHCAGISAGKKFGVAKKAKLIAVKVLSDSGSGGLDKVIDGIEWVTDQHKQKSNKKTVANLSLGLSGKSNSFNKALENSVKNGVHIAVSAGNANRDACQSSPGSAWYVVSTGSSRKTDVKSSFSNHGPCVDMFAPGSEIKSAWISSRTSTRTLSGTSMAAPHVAGVMALILSRYGAMTDVMMKWILETTSGKNFVKELPNNTPNRLLYSLMYPNLMSDVEADIELKLTEELLGKATGEKKASENNAFAPKFFTKQAI